MVVNTNNNPLTYDLTTEKLGTVRHCWVVRLANYNFQLYYIVRKANINADALLSVSWPMYMPGISDTQHRVTAAVGMSHARGHPQRPEEPH